MSKHDQEHGVESSTGNAVNQHSILFLITGASRGLGRSIALAFQQHFLDSPHKAFELHLHFALVARSLQGLEETQQQLEEQIRQETERSSLSISVDYSVWPIDLSDLGALETKFNQLLNDLSTPSTLWNQFILINNAGSLGALGPCWKKPQSSLHQMQSVINFNITSACWVSSRCLEWIMKEQTKKQILISTLVNISSLTAIQAFPTMALYSAGKAARDMFHACVEQELSNAGISTQGNQALKVLNYAPGPLETKMTEEIRAAPHLDESLKPHYDKVLVDANDSAKVLVALVTKNDFQSGSHVDYYDCL